MTDWFRQTRRHIPPRAGLPVRGTPKPPRASSIICAMTIVMLLLAMLAKALTDLLAAT